MVELYLHSPTCIDAWCLIKHRDNFTFIAIGEPKTCVKQINETHSAPVCLLNSEEPPQKFRGLVSQRTIPTERPPLVGEVSANFSG
jgi:hypothetical protein